ncbi:MAG: hypothetical protein IIX02_00785 [Clostridia bacterium]|nr:hypothetical protein [Clostridia bacterium]
MWFNILNGLMTVVQIFLPISLKTNVHYDMNRRKFAFSVYLFGFLRIFGGYIATYKGGLALHITDKKAILLPYSQINSERKRFSFIRTFRLKSLTLTTETGAEYLLPMALAYTGVRAYFFIKGGKKEDLEQNLWLTDGDVLRISSTIVVQFTIFMLLKQFVNFLKEKWRLWQKKTKKSTA